ncbi:MAG: hypothetical protein V3T70_11960, partial [Phycisphaerae bacterium]
MQIIRLTQRAAASTWVIGLVVLATRLPFLAAGYGADPDAWLVADTARQIAEHGEYAPSRPPGYPIQEFVCGLAQSGGPVALNGCTALLSVLAAVCFMRCLRRMGCADAGPAALALALTPVIYVNSVNAMDYVWALAFVLASLDALLHRRPLTAGLLLGAAIGCRITSALFVLP